MAVTEADVVEALRPVEDPELHRSIVDLGMVKGVAIDGGVAAVRIALTVAGCPLRNEIQNRVTGAVVALDGIDRVDLDFTVMTDEERAALREMLHGDPASTAGTHQGHGHAEGRAVPFADPSNTKFRMSFFGGLITQEYQVLEHRPTEGWLILSTRDGKYLWLMSQRPTLPAAVKAEAIARIRQLGFDPGRLEFPLPAHS